MMKRVVGIKVAASRFATGAESVARSSIYSKAYTEGSFKPWVNDSVDIYCKFEDWLSGKNPYKHNKGA